tara:strand:- start:17 stop:481 length:465 start_codon:yes stop_codon:yes gene_type:complete
MFRFPEVKAHCDIPCKIYDPSIPQIAVLSVIRLLDLIHELGDSPLTKEQSSQLIRLVDQKEIHSASVKSEIATIWGDYFKEPQISMFPDVHTLVHKIMQQASKCKQGIERQNGLDLLESVNTFAKMFWSSKNIETHYVVSPYPPALEIIKPKLG